jgi:hypothetical protein
MLVPLATGSQQSGPVIAPAPAATSDRLHLGSGQDEPDHSGDGGRVLHVSGRSLAAARLRPPGSRGLRVQDQSL